MQLLRTFPDLKPIPPVSQPFFRELKQPQELIDYFTLRHQVYAKQGYWRRDSRTLDIDVYDRHSRFVGCFNSDGRLIGGARFILGEGEPNAAVVDALSPVALSPRPHLYHSQSLFRFDPVLEHARRLGKPFVEFGRTVIHPDWQRGGLGVLLIHALYGLAQGYGVELGLAAVPPHLTRFYCSLGCRVLRQRGVSQAEGINTTLVPLVVDLRRLHGPLRPSLRAARALRLRGEWRPESGDHGGGEWLPEWPNDPPGHGWEPALSRLPLLRSGVRVQDQTLGLGLFSASAALPANETLAELLALQSRLGLEAVSLGWPGRGPVAAARSLQLARRLGELKSGMQASCWARARVSDVQAVSTIAQTAGQKLEVEIQVGVGPARRISEGWDLDHLLAVTGASVSAAVQAGLVPVARLEDAARTPADILEPVCHAALQAGAVALCLWDSSGHATPAGTRKLVHHLRSFLGEHGYSADIHWHGSNDRGLAVANCLAAIEQGTQRIHASLGGCGDRVGGAALEQLLGHLRRLSGRSVEVQALHEYLQWGRTHLTWLELPVTQPRELVEVVK